MTDKTRAVVGKVLVGLAVAGFAGALGVTVRSLVGRFSDDVRLRGVDTREITVSTMLLDGDRLLAVPATWEGPRPLLSAARADVGSPRAMRTEVLATLPPVGAGEREVTLAASRDAWFVTIAVPYALRGTYTDGAESRSYRIARSTHALEHLTAFDIQHQGNVLTAGGPEGFVLSRFEASTAVAEESTTVLDDIFVVEDGRAPRHHDELSDAIISFAGKQRAEPSVVSLHVVGGRIVVHLRAHARETKGRVRERVVVAPFAGGAVRVLAEHELDRTDGPSTDRLDVLGGAARGDGVWTELHRDAEGGARLDAYAFVPLDGSPPRDFRMTRFSVVGSTPDRESALRFVAGDDLVHATCETASCEPREVTFMRTDRDGSSKVLRAPYPSDWRPRVLAADAKDAFVVTGSDVKRLRL